MKHLVKRYSSPLLALLLAAVLLIAVSAAFQMRSVDPASTDATGNVGNDNSRHPVISLDGKRVVFRSDATNLVPEDNNGQQDVFFKNIDDGSISIASTNAQGAPGEGPSEEPFISGDGAVVTFTSQSSNLVPGVSGPVKNIYRKNIKTGAIDLVSGDAAGAPGNDDSVSSSASVEGRFVAFVSSASNLVAGDSNGVSDVFIKDMANGAITRVSTGPQGEQSNSVSGSIYGTSMSADGRLVAFFAAASNLNQFDNDNQLDVFVKDTQSGAVTLASTNADGVKGNAGSYNPAISADGRYVAFASVATNLAPGDTDGAVDIYYKDLQTGRLTLASANKDGMKALESGDPAISSDGRYVAFSARGAGLVPELSNDTYQAFIKDGTGGDLILASQSGSGAEGNDASVKPALDKNAGHIVFESAASNLVPTDSNGLYDIFLVTYEVQQAPVKGCRFLPKPPFLKP